jgi:hypothetical protein
VLVGRLADRASERDGAGERLVASRRDDLDLVGRTLGDGVVRR